MTISADSVNAVLSKQEELVITPGFDWTTALPGSWLIIGLFAGGWAHNHIPLRSLPFSTCSTSWT